MSQGNVIGVDPVLGHESRRSSSSIRIRTCRLWSERKRRKTSHHHPREISKLSNHPARTPVSIGQAFRKWDRERESERKGSIPPCLVAWWNGWLKEDGSGFFPILGKIFFFVPETKTKDSLYLSRRRPKEIIRSTRSFAVGIDSRSSSGGSGRTGSTTSSEY